MVVRATCALAVVLLMTTGTPFADDDSEPTKQTRPLEPTASDLEQFQLTETQIGYIGDSGNSPAFRASGVGMFAASAADLVTTELGLSQGFEEGNPAASRRGIRIATHVAGPAVVLWATERMRRSGKTKLALGLRIGLMVAYSYAAFHNTQLMTSGVP